MRLGRYILLLIAGWLALSIPVGAQPGKATTAQTAAPEQLAEFKSDGCSMFPDGNYYSCCYLHDIAYWPGGTKAEKDRADAALRACVSSVTGKPELGQLMFHGVQVGGGPGLHTSYRWGYGWRWPYRNDYAPLTTEELAQVKDKTATLCKGLKLNAATGHVIVDVDREITVDQAKRICPDLGGGSQ